MRFSLSLLGVLAGISCLQSTSAITIPGTTGPLGKIDAGFFDGGTILSLSASGEVILGVENWNTDANGALTTIDPIPGLYSYANAEASYPNVFGGDGINHFPGGGANLDGVLFGFAGENTTDTTDPDAIRFGALVGTFNPLPLLNSDWFFIGSAASIAVPSGGANLYLAINDTFHLNNAGAFEVNVSTNVPEGGGLALFAIAGLALAAIARSEQFNIV